MGYLTHVLVSCLILQTLALTYGFNFAEAGLGASSGGEPEERGTSCTRPALTDSHTDLADFNNQALAWHNYLRCVHNAPVLVLDNNLIKGSQVWAEKMASDGAISSEAVNGENVAMNTDSRNGGYIFVRGVYNTRVNNGEVQGYKGSWYCGEYNNVNFEDPNSNRYISYTGHLTQQIWKGTTSVGCGIKKGQYKTYGDAYYVACRYSPKGNRGDYSANLQDYITGYSYATVCPTPSS